MTDERSTPVVEVIVIPADVAELAYVERLPDDEMEQLDKLQALCDGSIDTVGLNHPPGVHVYYGADSKFTGLMPNARATALLRDWTDLMPGDYVAGSLVIAGDGPGGTEASAPDWLVAALVRRQHCGCEGGVLDDSDDRRPMKVACPDCGGRGSTAILVHGRHVLAAP
jgi:hypothetical protein